MNEQSRQDALIRQLQGALGGLALRVGYVSAAGTVGSGLGFTVTKVGTGDYRLNFDPPFQTIAKVVPMQGQGSGVLAIFKQHITEGSTTSTFRLQVYNTDASANIDTDFWFIAAG